MNDRVVVDGVLVWLGDKPDDNFWDDHWSHHVNRQLKNVKIPWYLNDLVEKLEAGCSVLEAGCGTGAIVSALKRMGFKIEGIDSATRTVEHLNSIGLSVRKMDVRNTDYTDDTFDAYVSLGVIEHFFDISETRKIIQEATRITKKGGLLYFSVPFTNRLRKSIIRNNIDTKTIVNENNFYQRSFDSGEMSALFSGLPLKIIKEGCYDAAKGIADEVSSLVWIKKKPWRIPFSLIDRNTCWLNDYGHMIYKIYQKV